MPHIYTQDDLREKTGRALKQKRRRLTTREWMPTTSKVDTATEVHVEDRYYFDGVAVTTRHVPEDFKPSSSYKKEKIYKPYRHTSGLEVEREKYEKNPEAADVAFDLQHPGTVRIVLEKDENYLMYGDIGDKGVCNVEGRNVFTVTGGDHSSKKAKEILEEVKKAYHLSKNKPGVEPTHLLVDEQLADIWDEKYFESVTGNVEESVFEVLKRKYEKLGITFKIQSTFGDSAMNATYGFVEADEDNIVVENLEGLNTKESSHSSDTKVKWRVSMKGILKIRRPWTITIADGASSIPVRKLDETDY